MKGNVVKLGTVLRKVRKHRDLSLQELANKAGVSAATISLVERNHRYPSLQVLEEMCLALGVPRTFVLFACELNQLEFNYPGFTENSENLIFSVLYPRS